MKIGVVVDNWKLPMFERALSHSGFVFEKTPFTADTTTLAVTCAEDRVEHLKTICINLQRIAFKQKQNEN